MPKHLAEYFGFDDIRRLFKVLEQETNHVSAPLVLVDWFKDEPEHFQSQIELPF